jgi:hypothetical protein
MFEPIEGAPAGIVAFKAVGSVEGADYETVLRPAIEAALAGHGKIRIVIELGPEYEGYTAGAVWEDTKLWAPHLRDWERCAVVTDHRFVTAGVRLFAPVIPGELKTFPVGELAAALAWAAEGA